MEEIVKGPDGGLTTKLLGPIAKDVDDPYAKECKLTN